MMSNEKSFYPEKTDILKCQNWFNFSMKKKKRSKKNLKIMILLNWGSKKYFEKINKLILSIEISRWTILHVIVVRLCTKSANDHISTIRRAKSICDRGAFNAKSEFEQGVFEEKSTAANGMHTKRQRENVAEIGRSTTQTGQAARCRDLTQSASRCDRRLCTYGVTVYKRVL